MLYDIHVHSLYSDGAAFPREIIKHAKKIGLSGIAITDHNEVKGARVAMKYNSEDFRVIPGIEVSSIDGHILGLGLTDMVPLGLGAGETIEKIHDGGGIAIAAHPYDSIRKGVGDLIFKLDFDAVEVYNGHTLLSGKNPESLVEDLSKPVTGGSDAHTLWEIGSVLMDMDGDPIEAILNDETDILVNTSRSKILINHMRRRLLKRRDLEDEENEA